MLSHASLVDELDPEVKDTFYSLLPVTPFHNEICFEAPGESSVTWNRHHVGLGIVVPW